MLAGLAAAVMLVLAVPTFSLHLGTSDQGNDPATTTTRKAYDLLAEGFGPGTNGPLTLVATTGGADGSRRLRPPAADPAARSPASPP